MTLSDWLNSNPEAHAVPARPGQVKGGVWLYANAAKGVRELFHLADYKVSSRSGSVLFLSPSTPKPAIESMNTPAKPSALSTFLGEAGAPEATVKVEVTGSPAAVQKAIGKLAKKPGKKPGANGGGPPMPKEEPELGPDSDFPEPGEPGEGDLSPAGGGDFDLPPEGIDDDELKEHAIGIVEALIKEEKPRPERNN